MGSPSPRGGLRGAVLSGFLLPLLLLLPATAGADEPWLAVEPGWDGAAPQGGVLPLRCRVRLPEASTEFWTLHLGPLGGPWDWELVLPLAPVNDPRWTLEVVLPFHERDQGLRAVLRDGEGRERARQERRLAWLPAAARLGLHLGRERGLRHVRGETASEEALWIRLPVERLLGRAAAYHDVGRVSWESSNPPRLKAAVQHALESWSEAYGRPLGAGDVDPGRIPPTRGLRWADLRRLARELEDSTRAPVGPVVLAWLVLLLALGIAPRARGAGRLAALLLALLGAAWLWIGAPSGPMRLDTVLSVDEGGNGRRSWELRVFRAGPGSGARWEGSPPAVVGPAWLPPGSGRWALWWWEPGTGQRRWEIRPPAGGREGLWMGFSPGREVEPVEGADPSPEAWNRALFPSSRRPPSTIMGRGPASGRLLVDWSEE